MLNNPAGMVSLRSDHGVDELLRRAVALIEAPGLEVVSVFDYSGDAHEAGLSMPATKLVVFGNPAISARLIHAHPTIALDLPFKLLISEDEDGRSAISYNAPASLAQRHQLRDDEVEILHVVETIAHAAGRSS